MVCPSVLYFTLNLNIPERQCLLAYVCYWHSQHWPAMGLKSSRFQNELNLLAWSSLGVPYFQSLFPPAVEGAVEIGLVQPFCAELLWSCHWFHCAGEKLKCVEIRICKSEVELENCHGFLINCLQTFLRIWCCEHLWTAHLQHSYTPVMILSLRCIFQVSSFSLNIHKKCRQASTEQWATIKCVVSFMVI